MTPEWLDLLDWKRRVFDLYREVRLEPDPEAAWRRWRAVRDELFATHPQSPLPPGRAPVVSAGSRTSGTIRPRACSPRFDRPTPASYVLGGSDGTPYRATRVADRVLRARRARQRGRAVLARRATAGACSCRFAMRRAAIETYGGGRYLLDTVKGADLGDRDGRLVLDFNFAYHPSCVYDGRWSCPLAPPGNRLAVPVRAGERLRRGRYPVRAGPLPFRRRIRTGVIAWSSSSARNIVWSRPRSASGRRPVCCRSRRRWTAPGAYPPELIQELGDLGLTGVFVPEAYGGGRDGLGRLLHRHRGDRPRGGRARGGALGQQLARLLPDPRVRHRGAEAQRTCPISPAAGSSGATV